MIITIESTIERLKIKQYPASQWQAFILLALLSILSSYHMFFQSPIFSSLTCSKDFFNRTNCQLVESAILNPNLTDRYIKNVKKPYKKSGRKNNVIWLTTNIRIWHRKIQNILSSSQSFFDPFLY